MPMMMFVASSLLSLMFPVSSIKNNQICSAMVRKQGFVLNTFSYPELTVPTATILLRKSRHYHRSSGMFDSIFANAATGRDFLPYSGLE